MGWRVTYRAPPALWLCSPLSLAGAAARSLHKHHAAGAASLGRRPPCAPAARSHPKLPHTWQRSLMVKSQSQPAHPSGTAAASAAAVSWHACQLGQRGCWAVRHNGPGQAVWMARQALGPGWRGRQVEGDAARQGCWQHQPHLCTPPLQPLAQRLLCFADTAPAAVSLTAAVCTCHLCIWRQRWLPAFQ